MDYEKKNKDAISTIKQALRQLATNGVPVDNMIEAIKDIEEKYAESEDERMIQYFKDLAPFDKADELYEKYGFSHKDAIAWLEKQKGHVKFINGIQVGDKVTRNEDGVLVNLSQLKRVAKPAEVQGEQKPVEPQQDMLSQEKYANAVDECIYGEQKPADGAEPKFKAGDIIRHKKQGFTCKIIAVDTEYRLSGCNGTHLPFDSQDAYELVEQKPAWSEEDERMFNSALWHVKNSCGNGGKNSGEFEVYNWLKSLKDRYTWKPSDEQMKALTFACIKNVGIDKSSIKALYDLKEQLKKLKE